MNIDTNGLALEDMAQDRIAGVRGKVVAFAQHVTGCARVALQPALDKDGHVPDWLWCDVLTVGVTKANLAEKPQGVSKGGPQRGEPRGRFA